jgi:DNA-binding IscR family transcriptional regulator
VTWGDGTFNLLPNGTAPEATITKESSQILEDIKAMTHEWETILEVVPSGKALFCIANLAEDNTGPITIPNVGWRVLSKLDGVRTVQEVAEILRIPFAYIAKVLFNLHQSGLVEAVSAPVKPVGDLVPAALLDRLSATLTEVIGPMAPLVMRSDQARRTSTACRKPLRTHGLIARISNLQRNKFEERSIRDLISNAGIPC